MLSFFGVLILVRQKHKSIIRTSNFFSGILQERYFFLLHTENRNKNYFYKEIKTSFGVEKIECNPNTAEWRLRRGQK